MKKSQPKPFAKYSWQSLLLLALVLQVAAFLYLVREIRQVDTKIDSVSEMQAAINSASMSAAEQKSVVVSVAENMVYIPEFKIKLPLNARTQTFTYTMRDGWSREKGIELGGSANISTLAVAGYSSGKMERISCASPVRLKVEDRSNPYNPHELNVASTKLSDGRTLQAYAHTHPDCATAYPVTGVDSKAMGAEFSKAQSY